jgi:hypothetical protein
MMPLRAQLTAAASVLLLAACGSAANPSKNEASRDSALSFSRCMRAHGVSNFPDPTSGGGIELAPSSGVNPQSPAFQTAQRSCQKLLPLRGAPAHMSASDRRAAVKFARCMRANGVPDFPDPTDANPNHASRVLVLRGMQFTPGPGLDPASPEFRRAAGKCGIRLPGGPPTQSAP